MTDDYGGIYPRYNRKFHRRKSVLGKDWTPPRLQDVTAGVWCSRCRTRHAYNGRGKVLSEFDRAGEAFVLRWLCPVSGDVLEERILERKVNEEPTSPVQEDDGS